MKKFTFVILMLISALMLSSCSLGIRKMLGMAPTAQPAKVKATKPASNANAVSITSANFTPHNLDVAAGTTVSWTNNDTAPHSVTSDKAGIFDSGPINPGASFTFTFAQAGTFPYHSTGEANILSGTIIVK